MSKMIRSIAIGMIVLGTSTAAVAGDILDYVSEKSNGVFFLNSERLEKTPVFQSMIGDVSDSPLFAAQKALKKAGYDDKFSEVVIYGTGLGSLNGLIGILCETDLRIAQIQDVLAKNLMPDLESITEKNVNGKHFYVISDKKGKQVGVAELSKKILLFGKADDMPALLAEKRKLPKQFESLEKESDAKGNLFCGMFVPSQDENTAAQQQDAAAISTSSIKMLKMALAISGAKNDVFEAKVDITVKDAAAAADLGKKLQSFVMIGALAISQQDNTNPQFGLQLANMIAISTKGEILMIRGTFPQDVINQLSKLKQTLKPFQSAIQNNQAQPQSKQPTSVPASKNVK